MEKSETEGKYQHMGYIHVYIHIYIQTHKKENLQSPKQGSQGTLVHEESAYINKLQCQALEVRKSQN